MKGGENENMKIVYVISVYGLIRVIGDVSYPSIDEIYIKSRYLQRVGQSPPLADVVGQKNTYGVILDPEYNRIYRVMEAIREGAIRGEAIRGGARSNILNQIYNLLGLGYETINISP